MGAEKNIVIKFLQVCSEASKTKSAKFLAKQARDIEIFGGKEVYRQGVSEEMLQVFTPFRRVSKKPCSLSDPRYFIEKYENLSKQIPVNWIELSEAEKVDYIVKERYGRLVVNKIMSTIKNEPVEHHFGVSVDGEILSHDIGCDISVEHINKGARSDFQALCSRLGINMKGTEYSEHISIHNHPHQDPLTDDVIKFLEENNKERPKAYAPFSGNDLATYCSTGEVGYVIDSAGNKFRFTPHCLWKGDFGVADSVRSSYGRYEDDIIMPLYHRMASSYDKYKKLKESGASIKSINAAFEEALESKTNFMTTLYNMQYRKEYLKSDLVRSHFGVFEELS